MNGLWWLWLIPAAGFFILLIRERLRYRAARTDLAYINDKLQQFTNKSKPLTRERLLVVTGEPQLQELLQGINTLLDRAHQSASDYVRTEQAMRMMLSNVSHDLKTPLTVIMGYAEVLERNADMPPGERMRMLSQVHRKAAEVHERINAFFDLTRLEAGDYELPLSVVDACEVCRHRILAYFDLLTERKVEVEIDLPDEPVWIYANEEALARILDNLLSNAVRYGADGGYLGLALTADRGNIRIDVTDRGPGIARSDQIRIFERMYTTEDSRNRSLQGSGLGLAIVKKLTERLGGRISLDSLSNERTCFSVTFPVSDYKSLHQIKK
ncbi:sensor histidine kinase [Paenibacillus sambharensis]|uniref:histidine kinase n=1 Tax=Paenibacillus sambharensis TaxID=1803190 RepID=A0A2W1LFP4_9BACL|nr:HAMP domain-containing sensor histidine kinase [Paenibacillus sambharensis]PZD97519.1 sensor histidine kinase [Paenibacillus sambharensis]